MFKKIHFLAATFVCFFNNNAFGSTCVDDPLFTERPSISTSSATMEGQYDLPKPVKVLVLEGGAVRMIIQKLILLWLRINTGKEPHQLFDLFVGSSAGVAVALQCAASTPDKKLKNPIKEIVQNHQREIEIAFSQPSLGRNIKTLWGLVAPRHSISGFLKESKKSIGDCMLSETLIPVVVPIIDRSTNQLRWLSTVKAQNNPERENFHLYQVAVAATAFPGFFRPVKMKSPITKEGQKENCLIAGDAGPIIYHPGAIALKEAREMLKHQKSDSSAQTKQVKKIMSDSSLTEKEKLEELERLTQLEHRIKMLDIGSGIPKKWVEPKVSDSSKEPKVPNSGLLQNIKPVIAQMFQGLGINARDGVEAFFGGNAKENYCRLQVLLTKEKDGTYPFVLDDINPRVTNALISQTIDYTNTPEFETAIRNFFGSELKTPLTPLKKEEFLIKTKPIKALL
ncbi:MAG: patatin-like phospholipase family protein [Alphaproteobacteria bacterium]